jgi:phosphotransferase system HPr-like phosphotransfer protein
MEVFYMVRIPIKIGSFRDIQALASLAAELPYKLQVGDGRLTVGAKSILSIFCLNLRGGLHLLADCPAEEEVQLRQQLGAIAQETLLSAL